VNHVSRATIAISPLLLILGIIAQGILLVMVTVLYVPCLIWPGMLNGPYLWITKGMGRIMVRSIFPRKDATKARDGDGTVTISLYDRAALGASGAARFCLQWVIVHHTGGTQWTDPE
jgi:hypothetical protein